MEKFLPKKLQDGATIGFLSVAGNVNDVTDIENAREYFESLGYNVKISETTYQRKNYLCSSDKARAEALNSFFADETIDVIIACRGGYGSLRILDKIDYELIKNNHKIFCGYSDITALQLMIYKKTGLITYNAPMIISDFANDISEYTRDSFFAVLKNGINAIKIDSPRVYSGGVVSGILWGGNLSTIQSLCGLDFLPDEKFIFVVEDINETVYKIDKMFTQLLNIPQFKDNIVAVVLGDFTGIDNQKYFDDYFVELGDELNIPIVSGMKFGHEKNKQTFPIGVNAMLDTNLATIFIK